jgi:hypothetical protein
MEGQGYLPYVVAITVDVATSGSGVQDVYTVPAGFWLEKAQGIVLEGLSAGTIDFGLDSDTDAIIDNTEWTETNTGALAASSQTTIPDGLYFSAVDVLRVEFGTYPETGKVLFLLWLWDLNSILSQGVHVAV